MTEMDNARQAHLDKLQIVLEEGLKDLAAARNSAEITAARHRARAKLQSLGFRAARLPGDED